MNTGKVEIRNGKVVKVFPNEIERVENLLKHLLSIHMKLSTNTQLKITSICLEMKWLHILLIE